MRRLMLGTIHTLIIPYGDLCMHVFHYVPPSHRSHQPGVVSSPALFSTTDLITISNFVVVEWDRFR